MKIILIQAKTPNISETLPLGIAYIGTELKNEGWDVKLVDSTAAYADYSAEKLFEITKEYNPDVIGFTTMTINILETYKAIKLLQKLNKPIIAGGNHATLAPEEVLKRGVNIVVRGEGERTIRELSNYFRNKQKLESIEGVSYVKDRKIIHNPSREPRRDLSNLGFPDRDLFNLKDYAKDKKELAYVVGTIVTSWGCPMGCTFCNKCVFGSAYRTRTAENVFEEALRLNKKYGCTYFRFVDDSMNIDHKRLREICRLFKTKGFIWKSNANISHMTKDLLIAMREGGCIGLTYGIESGDDYSLRMMKKGITVEKARQVVKWTYEVGIGQTLNFMFGFPWEKPENIENTIKLIKELSPYMEDIQRGSMVTPTPNTEIYEAYKDQYNYENWWLYPENFLSGWSQTKEHQPLYKKAFFQDVGHLDKNGGFYRYPDKIRKKIKKAIQVINRIVIHNKVKKMNITQKTYLNRVFEYVIISSLLLSRIFYSISPKFEKLILTDSYYFLRRKNVIK